MDFLGFGCGDPAARWRTGAERRQPIVASSVRVSPLLSTQVTLSLSPFLPPLNLNCR